MKKVLIGLGIFVVLVFGILIGYKYVYSMEVAENQEVGNANAALKVLIATQGSEYKNQLVAAIVTDESDVYFKVIDVSQLDEVQYEAWDAFVVMHTWEVWEPEPNAAKFLEEYKDAMNVFVVSTSGGGDLMIDGVNGISGASSLTDVKKDAETVRTWLRNFD